IMCGDNSRFHSNCVWADRPCEEGVRVLSECRADRSVRETRPNFENIVRVVAPPPEDVLDRADSSAENWQLYQSQTSASHWQSKRPGSSRSLPIGSRKMFQPMLRSHFDCRPQ